MSAHVHNGCGLDCARTEPDVSVRYLLVELPLMTEESSGFDPDEQFYRIRNDVSEFLWEDPALAEPPTVRLVYPGDVVPGGEPE